LAVFTAGLVQSALVTFSQGIRWPQKISPLGWKLLAVFTLFSIVALGCLMMGLALIEASTAGFLSRASVIVIMILGIFFLHERFKLLEALSALILLAGIIIIRSCVRVEIAPGFWWMLTSAFTFGIVEIIAKISVKHISPLHLNALRNSAVGVILILWALAKGAGNWDLGNLWFGVIAIGITGPLIARQFYLYALKNLEVSKTSLITQIQPVFVLVLSYLVLAERPCGEELLGGGLIVFGCFGLVFMRENAFINFLWHRMKSKFSLENRI
jgi:drug/metabolite transporter (DMT)-like permease